MKRTAVLVAFTALVVGATARADVVGPDQDINCPRGSHQERCHGSEYCQPDRCADATECGDDETCEEVDWCINSWTCGMGGSTVEAVEGNCGGGGDCSEGTCETLNVCMPAEIFSDAGGGCECGVTGGGDRTYPAAGFALAAVTILFGCWLRRRNG